jgi:ubiquinone/menaquinone biosynthesis C-methylase UbiE
LTFELLTMPKDLFSNRSDLYSLYRPGYPDELFEYIFQFLGSKKIAWDCATGNGQAAKVLSRFFQKVEASDISSKQIAKAFQKENIHYSLCPAEKTPFPPDYFDLITVATAYHWLKWKEFKKEVKRVSKPGAIIAIWAYNLLRSKDRNLDSIIENFYHNVIGEYWETERKHVDENYSTVEFEYEELPSKTWEMELTWTKAHFIGFLESWSAVQTYIQKNQSNPLLLIKDSIDAVWGDQTSRTFYFPLFLRLGKIGV